MIGQTISHYKILEKLGEGGMGVVYKAEDTKLKRLVALKFLPENLIKDSDAKDRFLTEAQAAAALNHSNIITVYEINEYKNRVYIVMEFVEGENLKEKIHSGPLKIDEVLRIVKQICKGLQEAHDKDVIHRDIKSANIMIEEKGQIKIMDFGLARLKNQPGMTKVGSTIGTASYMSPEQGQGAIVDHRSDIWSLGVVLYELVTGETPFKGEYEQSVIYSIINEVHEPLSSKCADVPEGLRQIINKTLAKNPENRYQKAADLLKDIIKLKEDSKSANSNLINDNFLKPVNIKSKKYFISSTLIMTVIIIWLFILWQSKTNENGTKIQKTPDNINQPSPLKKKIVVLPFENLGSPEDEYFADGITEEITARLAGLKGLGVIARISAKHYKNTNKSARIIGKELGVDYLIEGTIRWQKLANGSNRVRITPQLIRTSDNTHIWAEVYDRDLIDIFAVQAFIAEQVASSLDITLLEGQRENLAIRPTKNMEAYSYYLKAKSLYAKDEKESTFLEALQKFKKAVNLDPNFAEAWASLSSVHSTLYWFYYDRSDQRIDKAKYAVEKAFELRPGFPLAHKALGDYYYHCKLDYKQALEQYTKARRGLGENSELFASIGYVKRRQGEWKDALDFQTKAYELDPRSPTIVRNLTETHVLMRNYQYAERLFKISYSLNLTNADIYSEQILNILLWKGDTKRGIKLLDEAFQRYFHLENSLFINSHLLLFMCNKNYKEALDRLSSFSKESIDDQFVFIPKALIIAQIHQLNKQPSRAQVEFEKALRVLQFHLKKNPLDSRIHSSLGLVLAGLGKKAEAVKEGNLGVELMPIKKEAYRGFSRALDLAQIYTMIGKNKKAISQIEYLLSVPGYLSIELLRIDPKWDPLRNNPHFKKLLKEGKQYSYIANVK